MKWKLYSCLILKDILFWNLKELKEFEGGYHCHQSNFNPEDPVKSIVTNETLDDDILIAHILRRAQNNDEKLRDLFPPQFFVSTTVFCFHHSVVHLPVFFKDKILPEANIILH